MSRAELEIGDDEIVLLDTADGIRQEVWAYLTSSVVEPMAFVNKTSTSSISRVVIFTVVGVQGVYDRYNLIFAFQVSSSLEYYWYGILLYYLLTLVPQYRTRGCCRENPSCYRPVKKQSTFCSQFSKYVFSYFICNCTWKNISWIFPQRLNNFKQRTLQKTHSISSAQIT